MCGRERGREPSACVGTVVLRAAAGGRVCAWGSACEQAVPCTHRSVHGVRSCVCIVRVREQSSLICTGEGCTLCVHSTSDLCCSSPWGHVPRAWHEAPGDWASCLVPVVLCQVVLCRAQHVALGPTRSSTQTPRLRDLSSAPGNCRGAWREGRR